MISYGMRTRDPRQRPASARPPPRLRYVPVPAEIWGKIYKYLERGDILNLTLVSRHFGGFARLETQKRVRLSSASQLLPYYYDSRRSTNPWGVQTVQSLTINLCLTTDVSLESVFEHWLAMLPHLSRLRELMLLGKMPKREARDVLASLSPSTRLIKFTCESDALLCASWESLCSQKDLVEFGGFHDMFANLPVCATPDVFPNLRILNTAAPFLLRLTAPSRVTHLSVKLARLNMPRVLGRVSNVLGSRLVSLRLERTFMAAPSLRWCCQPSYLWGTPMEVGSTLNTPLLEYLEIKDTVEATSGDWPEVDWTVHDQAGWSSRPVLILLTNLKAFAWRPVWAHTGRTVPHVAELVQYIARVFFPVLWLALSLEKNELRAGWDVWRRQARDASFKPDWRIVPTGGSFWRTWQL